MHRGVDVDRRTVRDRSRYGGPQRTRRRREASGCRSKTGRAAGESASDSREAPGVGARTTRTAEVGPSQGHRLRAEVLGSAVAPGRPGPHCPGERSGASCSGRRTSTARAQGVDRGGGAVLLAARDLRDAGRRPNGVSDRRHALRRRAQRSLAALGLRTPSSAKSRSSSQPPPLREWNARRRSCLRGPRRALAQNAAGRGCASTIRSGSVTERRSHAGAQCRCALNPRTGAAAR